MATIKVERILIFGSLSYGSSTVNTSPDNPPVSGFAKLVSQNKSFFFPKTDITFIYFKKAPRFTTVGTIWKKLTLFGEASFINARVIPSSAYSKFNIPDFLTNQIAFIADGRIILTSESQVLSIET